MTDYIRVFETSDKEKVNELIGKGWRLIDTVKVPQSDEYGEHIGGYMNYVLGFSTNEYANRLLSIIREYERHDLKDVLFEKMAKEQGDQSGIDSPLGKFMINYENMVGNEEKEDADDLPFVIGDIKF